MPCLYIGYVYEIVDAHSVRRTKMRDFGFPNDLKFSLDHIGSDFNRTVSAALILSELIS